MKIYSKNNGKRITKNNSVFQILIDIFVKHINHIDQANGYRCKDKGYDLVIDNVGLKYNRVLNCIDVYQDEKLVNSFVKIDG